MDLLDWTKIEWNRILKAPDYSQLFIKSRKKLSKDKINNDVRQLLRDEPGRIVVIHYIVSYFHNITQLLWCPLLAIIK